jgi:hypothetical protein
LRAPHILNFSDADLDPTFFFLNFECFFRGREIYVAG